MSMPSLLRASKFQLIFITAVLSIAFSAQAALKNYISYDLEYRPFEQMREQLEGRLKITLKNRGEAHITVITPPEFALLVKKIPADEIHAIAEAVLKSKPAFEIRCVGGGSIKIKGKKESTYYVVVKSEVLLKIRQTLSQRAGLSVQIFNPQLFYPHITLGFTDRDLHYEDGLIKDESTCLK